MSRKREQAAKDSENRGWIGRFSRGQVVVSCVAGVLSLGTTFAGAWAYLTRAPHVELAFHGNIEARWDAKDRRLSFDCFLVADNTNGSAADTLQAVRADLRTASGLTLRLGRIEMRDDTRSLQTPFVVVKEGQALPMRLTMSSGQLAPDAAPPSLGVGLYTLTVEFEARTSKLARSAQAYCFYLGRQAADDLQVTGELLPEPDDRCSPGVQLADARGVSRTIER